MCEKLENEGLTFVEAVSKESNTLSTQVLFVGSRDTACRYAHIPRARMYNVTLNKVIRLIDGFAAYDALCELEPDLVKILYKQTPPGQAQHEEWHRNSESSTDYAVFDSLETKLNASYNGIAWKKRVFKNFHNGDGEIVLFRSAANLMKIKDANSNRKLC